MLVKNFQSCKKCCVEEDILYPMWLPLPPFFSMMGFRVVLTLQMVTLLHTGSCHAGLRARDPGVDEEMQDHSEPGTVVTAHFPAHHVHGHHSMPGLLTPPRESSHQPARTGNWCAFVHQRVLTIAVLCGTETHTVKTENPCSNGDPNCQISKYQLSTRPVYRQKQKIISALHWKCCPGHKGPNCEDKDEELQPIEEPIERTQSHISGADESEEKDTDLLEDGQWDHNPVQPPPSGPVLPVPEHDGPGDTIPPPASLPYLDSVTLLTVHQVFAAVMTQLQPVLNGFNHTLQHLSSEVKELSLDLQKLRDGQEGHVSNTRHSQTVTIEEKLEDSFAQIQQIEAQLDMQQKQMKQTLQSQQQLLQDNFTILKEEMGQQISQSHEDIQVSLQLLNHSVEEIRHNQEYLDRIMQGEYSPSVDVSEGQSAMWEAINRLDKKVLSNTMQLSTLSENSTHLMIAAQKLDHCLLSLNVSLEQVSQASEIHFTETGLELEAAKVDALNSVNELAANISSQERQLRELELYLDNIYQHIQRNEASTIADASNCKEIRESLTMLELKVANVTDLASENRYALEDAEATRVQGHLPTQVEDLHQALLSVKESVAFEQAKSRTLNDNISHLKALLMGSQQEIIGLKESFAAKAAEIRHMSASFSSLLNDAIRHSEVLEVLLGDEVMEFSSWTNSQQKELSIPVLLQRMQMMQEKIETHESKLASLGRKDPERRDQMTGDDPVAFSEWILTKDQERDVEDHQDYHYSPSPSTGEDDGDYSVSDFWSLGKEVEELADRISQLEQQHCNCTAAPAGSVMDLQREIISLRQALGDHLRIFQNLFSYSEELVSSSRSLDLDQVWTIITKKDRKRKKGQEEKSKSVRVRSKRNTGEGSSYFPVAFIASLPHRTNTRGTLVLKKVAPNHGHAYSPSSGEFLAPQTGMYLFVVTLNFEKDPFLLQLKQDTVPVATLRQINGAAGPISQVCLLELQRGEKITLELLKGRLHKGHLNDNTFSGVLLLNTEDKNIQ